jgi:hypothetical protein
MEEQLYKYLVLHYKLSIPNLGNFSVESVGASVEGDQLLPPSKKLHFEEGMGDVADKVFFAFLAEELGVDDVTAITSFHEYAGKLRDSLQISNSVEIRGIGSFSKGEVGELLFVPEASTFQVYKPITLDQTLQAKEEVHAADYWWFWALLLLIIGIGAFIYYYI